MSKVRRPIVRYHGGKWKLAPWIISQMPSHEYYVEPFGGGGSILLRKDRCRQEVYNDLDREIVNLFRVVRDQGYSLQKKLADTPYSRDEFALSYTPSADPLEQARRTVVRGFMGFGSAASSGEKTGFRAQNHGNGTSCAGDWKNYPEALEATIERMRGVVIENTDATSLISQQDHVDALLYCDPPYVHSTRKKTKPYCKKGYRFEMSDDDHIALAKTLHSASGMVMLSGYSSPLYDELYGGWARIDREALADGAKLRLESLWFNKAAAGKSSQGVLL